MSAKKLLAYKKTEASNDTKSGDSHKRAPASTLKLLSTPTESAGTQKTAAGVFSNLGKAIDAMIPLDCFPRHHKRPPDEIEVARDALSNTYVCLFDGACRLALEATSPAERAVPCSRHIKWSKV